MVSYISIVMVVHLVVDQHIPAVHMSVRSNKMGAQRRNSFVRGTHWRADSAKGFLS